MRTLAGRLAFVLAWPFLAALVLVAVAAVLLVAWIKVPTSTWPREP